MKKIFKTRKVSLFLLVIVGLYISYDHLSTLSTQLGNSVVKRFEKDGLVCPVLVRNNVFTRHVVDKIDHNPSSGTAQDSWHSTAISETQHMKGKKKRSRFLPGPEVSKRQTTYKDIASPCYAIHQYFPICSEDIFTPSNDG